MQCNHEERDKEKVVRMILRGPLLAENNVSSEPCPTRFLHDCAMAALIHVHRPRQQRQLNCFLRPFRYDSFLFPLRVNNDIAIARFLRHDTRTLKNALFGTRTASLTR